MVYFLKIQEKNTYKNKLLRGRNMDTMKITCSTCVGRGKHCNWKIVSVDDVSGTMEREEVACKACNGTGYTEYAIFTPEEARAILKYCGLSTEN